MAANNAALAAARLAMDAASSILPSHSPTPHLSEQAFQQLAHAYQQQQHQIEALGQQLHQAQAAAAASSHPPRSGDAAAAEGHASHSEHHSPLTKLLSKPSVFHGNHGNRVFDWIAELEILFENCSEEVTDARKVSFGKQFLRDEALRWWITRERDANRAVQANDAALMLATPVIHTWAEFKSALTEYFAPRASAEAARAQIHGLSQADFKSLTEYIDWFENTSRRITVPPGHSIEDELVLAFKRGLSDKNIRLALTTGHPTTLYQATRLAIQADSDLRVAGFSRPGEHTNSNYFRRSTRSFRSSPNTGRRYQEFSPSSSYRQGDNNRNFRPSFPHPRPHGDGATPMDLSMLEDGGDGSEEAKSESSPDREQVSPAPGPGYGSDGHDSEEDARELPPSEKVVSMMDSGRRPYRPPPRPGSNGRTPSDGCWNCGQLDHMARDCPRPRREGGYRTGQRSFKSPLPSSLQHPKKQ